LAADDPDATGFASASDDEDDLDAATGGAAPADVAAARAARAARRRQRFDPDAPLDASEVAAHFGLAAPGRCVVVRAYATTAVSAGGGAATDDDDARALEAVAPSWVIMYDPDVAFVRRLEIFNAVNPHLALTVYFMVYDNSVEEQRYLSQLRREKEAFEKLIREKAIMAIPIDQDGRVEADPEERFWRTLDTRISGGRRVAAKDANQVIVDVREFASALPSLLHARGLVLRPVTLEVGDYVLTPAVCVERKSLPDLAQSFRSGRLFAQAEQMTRTYRTPVLLVEFAGSRAFDAGLGVGPRHGAGGGGGPSGAVTVGTGTNGSSTGGAASDPAVSDMAADLASKLVLLVLTFPRLRIIWSASPSATAEIFEDLKRDQPEPDLETAMAVGVDSDSVADGGGVFAVTPADMVRALPGVTHANRRRVMSRVATAGGGGSLRALAGASEDQCRAALGGDESAAAALHSFLQFDPRIGPLQPGHDA
ncbi:hypothetical protein HK405_011956, partial [Cladochytrium tenue]